MPATYALQSQLALPFIPTTQEVLERVIAFLKGLFAGRPHQKLRFVDLGAGDGRVVHAIAKEFPRWDCRGIEINRELCEAGQNLVKDLPNAHLAWGDLFQEKLKKIDIVFLFVLPTIMPYLRHVFNTLTKQALIITIQYPLQVAGVPVKEIFHEIVKKGTRCSQFFAYKVEAG